MAASFASYFSRRRPEAPTNATTTASLDPSPPRPVCLQSPADLLHLRALALKAARAKIDAAFPPDVQPSSSRQSTSLDVRAQVEQLVDEFIDNTFSGVRQSVEINGISGPEAVTWEKDAEAGGQEYETYDGKLAGRITELHGRIETLNLEVADRRREGVRRAAEQFRERYLGWDGGLAKEEEEGVEEAELEGLEVDRELVGREEMAKQTWERALSGLVALNKAEEGGLKAAGEKGDAAMRVLEAVEGR